MAKRTLKTTVVAFKAEEELAEFLNKLPNKSEFIRKAIAAQLAIECPLCRGAGNVPRAVHDHYAPLIKANSQRDCDGCGDSLPLPRNAGELSADDRSRLDQFFRGGPLYCDDCYESAPPCDDCGWHISPDSVADHLRQAHTRAK
jgi:hypothetical protein